MTCKYLDIRIPSAPSPTRVQYASRALKAIFHIGLIGFALYVATFFAGLFGTRSYGDSCRYLTLISPFFVTSLFFQPVIDAPLFMAVLFLYPPTARKT